jgi:tetratricopeptide (TPR) repeat protein
MKRIILVSALLLSVSVISAQKLTTQSLKEIEISKNKKILEQAFKYSDGATAINSLHQIIALEGDNSKYKDSLAITYFQSGNFVSSHLLSKELLVKKPNNLQLLEISAISLQKLNAVKEAIDAYDKLFAQTNNMAQGYQLATLQYSIKRLAEAKVSIAKALQCKVIENAAMSFPVGKEQTQSVPLKAAAFNLEGIIAFELKDYASASAAFKEAISLMPKFEIASKNANAVLQAQQKSK